MAALTTIAALKAHVQYPLPAAFFESVMMKRGLAGDAACTNEILNSLEFKGAMADCIRQIILYPSSISEGGMSISKADRQSLLGEANRLYRAIGEEPIDERPKVTCY
jgi:hypothetical protein